MQSTFAKQFDKSKAMVRFTAKMLIGCRERYYYEPTEPRIVIKVQLGPHPN